MTKEEAKLVLDNARPQTKEIDRQFYDDEDLNNALDMAIKALEQQSTTQQILSHIETGITATGQSDSYCVGFCNALVWLKACITHEEPQFFEDGRGVEND